MPGRTPPVFLDFGILRRAEAIHCVVEHVQAHAHGDASSRVCRAEFDKLNSALAHVDMWFFRILLMIL